MKKYFLTIVFVLVLVFCLGKVELVKAIDAKEKSGDCSEVIKYALMHGKAYNKDFTGAGIFFVTDDDSTETQGDEKEKPSGDGQTFCVLVNRGNGDLKYGRPYATYDEAKDYGIFAISEESLTNNDKSTLQWFDGNLFDAAKKAGKIISSPVTGGVGGGEVAESLAPKSPFWLSVSGESFVLSDNNFGLFFKNVDKSGNTLRWKIEIKVFFAIQVSYIYFLEEFKLDGEVINSIAGSIGADCKDLNGKSDECAKNTNCLWRNRNNICYSVYDKAICPNLEAEECKLSKACVYDPVAGCKVGSPAAPTSAYGKPAGYSGLLPDCVFEEDVKGCRDVNDLLQLLINWGEFSLGAVGAFAFVFFVYGGFTIITSFGNAERVKKGQQILVAAVVGIVICLVAYLVIDFMLTAIGVDPSFRAIK